MEFITNEKLLKQLNALIDEWKSQFENPPANFDLKFTVNSCEMLVLNGVVLCGIRSVIYDTMSYDEETLSFVDKNGFMYEIAINWPYNEAPYLSYIHKAEILYCAP